MVLVKEVGPLFGEVPQLRVPSEEHHVCVDGLLPPERAPSKAFLPPLQKLWVISALRRARAQMFALTPLATHLPDASPSNTSGFSQNLSAFSGYVTLLPGFSDSYVQW